MSKNLDVIVYPTGCRNPLIKYVWNEFDKFYEACGSTRFGVIKFIRGVHKNRYYDHLRKETGKWPSVNAQIWKNIPLGDLIHHAYMGSQRAARNLIKRTNE